MEPVCRLCHAILPAASVLERCPACGGELLARAALPILEPEPEIDHRGIALPRRHPVGGIITPQ